jgi:3-hydroxymyristoyl/3-hydroxydecanoyl-(acyl carrier protein) dehydratase
MIDDIRHLDLAGGAKGLGVIAGAKHINPEEWFFAAHFYQDPVMPGSLGLEAMTQLVSVLIKELWPQEAVRPHRVAPAAHHWQYRGQVIPRCREMMVVVDVEALDLERGQITVKGTLAADGLCIYQLSSMTFQC